MRVLIVKMFQRFCVHTIFHNTKKQISLPAYIIGYASTSIDALTWTLPEGQAFLNLDMDEVKRWLAIAQTFGLRNTPHFVAPHQHFRTNVTNCFHQP